MADKRGKGKFVIKPFRPSMTLDQEQATRIWESLRTAIGEIHRRNASQLSFEELYRNAYNLVLHKHGELLYRGVRETVREHLEGVAARVAAAPDDMLLPTLVEAWQEHTLTSQMSRDILMYMDRTFCVHSKKAPVYTMGLELFWTVVVRHAEIADRLRALLLAAVDQERRGDLIDRVLMKQTLAMLVDLGAGSTSVYESVFEEPFLAASEGFYRNEASEYLASNTVPDYLRKAQARLDEERARVTHYLHQSTDSKLRIIVEAELIARHAEALVAAETSGAVAMMRDDKLGDLRLMYTLFCRVPHTLAALRQSMGRYIEATGRALVADQETTRDPVAFVGSVLNLRDKYGTIVGDAFRGEKESEKRLKQAFEAFVNEDARCATFLALYVDHLLKSGLRGLTEPEVDASLDKVIVIHRYLTSKDVFEACYKTALAKRLLGGRSVSDEAERLMISKIKSECGYQYSAKMEGMFKDQQISKETNADFHRSTGALTHGIELNLHILTSGWWPPQAIPQCTLPPLLQQCCEAFKAYYDTVHNGRRLAWATNMGSVDMRAKFGARRYELSVSTFQACVLLLFNDAAASAPLAYSDLVATTNIEDKELRRHVLSLCTSKFRILQKSSRGKGIADADTLTVNDGYSSKLRRVRIPLISMKDPSANAAAVPADVEEDRRHSIEAAIVRVMKTRNVLEHNNLIAEVVRQLQHRFTPSPVVIKKRIESLIEREYLQRDAADRRRYQYMA